MYAACGLLDSTGSKAGRLRLHRPNLYTDLLVDHTFNRRSRLRSNALDVHYLFGRSSEARPHRAEAFKQALGAIRADAGQALHKLIRLNENA